MVSPTSMRLPATEIVVDLDEPETCPRCTSAMTAVQLRLEATATPTAATEDAAWMRLGVTGSVATALPCRCVVSARTDLKEPAVPATFSSSLEKPPADRPRAWHRWYPNAAEPECEG